MTRVADVDDDMKIRRVSAIGLRGAPEHLELQFNPDLNIITGRNGSGKTTLLKLIWYILSGNVPLATRELNFNSVELETTKYVVRISQLSDGSKIWVESDGFSGEMEASVDSDGDIVRTAAENASDYLSEVGGSIFFPTFRRIEGGFSTRTSSRGIFFQTAPARPRAELEEALSNLSRSMSRSKHQFVTSISTVDIVDLLAREYTTVSARANHLQNQFSQRVTEQILRFKQSGKERDAAETSKVLDEILSDIEIVDGQRTELFASLRGVEGLVEKILRRSGIKFSQQITFGTVAGAISSDALSAGEKQMMSFLCYNAFSTDRVIVIDEPELSLHVDWQRLLFPTLLEQNSDNQFVIATHSPFIYAHYPDKELVLATDKGQSTGDEL